jgi:hypothetical protein
VAPGTILKREFNMAVDAGWGQRRDSALRRDKNHSTGVRVEALEDRRLLSAAASSFSYVEPGGTMVDFLLRGAGTLHVQPTGDRAAVTLEGSTAASRLRITTHGGDGRATFSAIRINGSLRQFLAPSADVVGDITVTGSLDQLTLGNVLGDAALHLATGGRTRLTLGQANGLTIDAPSAGFSFIKADNWLDGSTPVQITAASLARLQVGGKGAAGDFQADITAGGIGRVTIARNATFTLRADSAQNISINGDLSDSKLVFIPAAGASGKQGLGKLTVGGTMRNTWIQALSNIGSVRAGAMIDSNLMAGIRFTESSPGVFEQMLPKSTPSPKYDFTGTYAIKSVSVGGLTGRDFSFSNTRIAAYNIGNVTLNGVEAHNNDREFGVSAYKLRRVSRRFGGPDAGLTNQENPKTDFVIRQIFRPLTFRPGNGYGNYYGGPTGSSASSGTFITIGTTVDPTGIGENGTQLGTVTGGAAGEAIYLMRDGSYQARNNEGLVMASTSQLSALILQVVGAPGTSIKVVDQDTVLFLSTSVGPRILMSRSNLGHAYADYSSAPQHTYDVGTPADLATEMRELGAMVDVFNKPLIDVPAGDEGVVVARSFDDLGLRTIRLLDSQVYEVEQPDGTTFQTVDLGAALLGGDALLGAPGRRPLQTGFTGKTFYLYGLGRGGTTAFYYQDENMLNARGDVVAMPTAANVQGYVKQHLGEG